MEILSLFFTPAIFVFLLFITFFIISAYLKDNSVVDIAWGLGFMVALVSSVLSSEIFGTRQLITTLLVTLWGLRLAIHIYLRNKGKGEDFRYKNFRKNWGGKVLINSFFKIYMLQAILCLIIASPAILINSTKGGALNIFDLLGIAVWVIGFFFEAVGDYQLSIFKKDPNNKGKIMKYGVWKYSRHPNYFGEATLWWGLFIMALNHPFGYATVVGPLLIDYMLLKVSGIPMLEKKYKGNKEFEEYKRKTSAFFPLPPKK